MGTTYITRAARALVIDSMIDAMLEVGDITETQIAETEAWLAGLSNPELRRECDDRCPDEWHRLVDSALNCYRSSL
jgi:hypothetical protein